MPAFFFSNTLSTLASVTGAANGKWFRVKKQQGATHVPVNVDITSGTGTLVLEGANIDPTVAAPSNPVQILSVSATGGSLVGWYPYMRVRYSGATTLVSKVTVGTPVKQIEP